MPEPSCVKGPILVISAGEPGQKKNVSGDEDDDAWGFSAGKQGKKKTQKGLEDGEEARAAAAVNVNPAISTLRSLMMLPRLTPLTTLGVSVGV